MRGPVLLAVVAVLILLVPVSRLVWLFVDPRRPFADQEGNVSTTGIVEDFPTPNVSAAFLAAEESVRAGDYKRALRDLKACEPEEGPCLALRGEMQLLGLGVARNFSEALRLLTEGADRGHPDAQYSLGALYSNLFEEGDALAPVPPKRREAEAVLYLYAASLAGHPGALMSMGYRHMLGYGVPKACSTAALNYVEVARRVAEVYSTGMPQAVELVRLGVDGKDWKGSMMSSSEVSLFVEIASSGDAGVAASVGKRFLLGIDGFRQDYKRAARHLRIAADKNHAGAMALLGYMYCLGLGVAKSLDVAYSYFISASAHEDPVGHNGLGYIYFHGTKVHDRDLQAAFRHFNSSAYGGSADGMFNLASLYLTGTGVEQSFQRASIWFMQALDHGHTPAAYALAVMHLHGIGTVRNCKIAVDLLKRVCERGTWVSRKLREAYEHSREKRQEAAAWHFLSIAEAGHEVGQVNLAHMLDDGSTVLLHPANASLERGGKEARLLGRIYAQRHYELSAEQGNALAELRLGDYAYYGWGLKVETGPQDVDELDEADALAWAEAEEPRTVRQEADVELSLAHYKRTASMRITGEWMQPFVARASFNLGYMHQFGIGVAADSPLARRYYHRCLEADPAGVRSPVALMLAALAVQVFVMRIPPLELLGPALLADLRTHVLAVLLVAVAIMCHLRRRIARRPAVVPRLSQTGQSSTAAAASCGETAGGNASVGT